MLVDLAELPDSPAGRRAAQPRQLIVTVYGLYARESGGWLSVASLVRLLANLGVDEPAVRSSISRLKRRGILESARVDGIAGYALSEEAGEILREGDERIFHRHRAEISDGWLLVVFSVPESERHKRHLLRAQLTRFGFGTAAPGVWIAPAHLYEATETALRQLRLESYVDMFRSDYRAFGELSAQVRRWWDLDLLQKLYDDFLATYTPMRVKWSRRRSDSEPEAFADYVRILTDWRRFPYLDPGLPEELLPKRWHGARAAELFFGLRERLGAPAHRHVERVTSPLA